jgi:RNA polymerase sigma-70 factor (ECF subfamily)
MRARWCSTLPRADDLAQNTLERALAHWHQFDQRRDMLVWVLSIAHNAFQDSRRRDTRLTIADPDDLARAQDRAGGDPGPDVGLRMDLLAALKRLAPEQREPLLLVCVEQLSATPRWPRSCTSPSAP